MWIFQGSADSNYSQPSSDLSLDEEKETLRREKERQALSQLEKARVSTFLYRNNNNNKNDLFDLFLRPIHYLLFLYYHIRVMRLKIIIITSNIISGAIIGIEQ